MPDNAIAEVKKVRIVCVRRIGTFGMGAGKDPRGEGRFLAGVPIYMLRMLVTILIFRCRTR